MKNQLKFSEWPYFGGQLPVDFGDVDKGEVMEVTATALQVVSLVFKVQLLSEGIL